MQPINSNYSSSHKPNPDFYSPKTKNLDKPFRFHIYQTEADFYPRKAKKIVQQKQEVSEEPSPSTLRPISPQANLIIDLTRESNSNPAIDIIDLTRESNSNPAIDVVNSTINQDRISQIRIEEALLAFLNKVFFPAIEYENSLANPNASKRPDEISAWFLKEVVNITENQLDFYFSNGSTIISMLFDALKWLHVEYEFVFIKICSYFIKSNTPLKINKHTTLSEHLESIEENKNLYSYIYSSIFFKKLHPFTPIISPHALGIFWQKLNNGLRQTLTNFIRLNVAIKFYVILDEELRSFQLEHDLKVINSDENNGLGNLAVTLLDLMINTLNEKIYYMSSWNNMFSKLCLPRRAMLIQNFESEINRVFEHKIQNFSIHAVAEFIEQINTPRVNFVCTNYKHFDNSLLRNLEAYEYEVQSLAYNVSFPKYKICKT